MQADNRSTDSHQPAVSSFGHHSSTPERRLKIQQESGAIEVQVRGKPALLHFGQIPDSLEAMTTVIDPLLADRFPLTRKGMPYDEETMIPGTRITIGDFNNQLSQPIQDLQRSTAVLESMEGVGTALETLEGRQGGRREHLIGIVTRALGSIRTVEQDLQSGRYDRVRELFDKTTQQVEQRIDQARQKVAETVETYFKQFEGTEVLYEKAKGVIDS